MGDRNGGTVRDLTRGVPPEVFHEAYADEPPAWDIPRAQSAVVTIADAGGFAGRVIDLGCGTGENALFLSARGYDVLGVDLVPRAVERARAKATERGLSAAFETRDVLELSTLDRVFDAALDSGVFHVFSDADRLRYVRSVASILAPGGRLHVLCFSEHTPGDEGPRRVRAEELRATFDPGNGFRVVSIDPAHFETLHAFSGRAAAWHLTAARSD